LGLEHWWPQYQQNREKRSKSSLNWICNDKV
jgi:hypothetical protein